MFLSLEALSLGRTRKLALVSIAISGALLLSSSRVDAQSAGAPPVKSRRKQAASAPVEDDRQRAARSLFDAGTIAFRQTRYEDALENFQQAYKLTDDPVLLFSIGMAYDRLLRLPEAVHALEQYLEAMPDAPNRRAAEERIRVIREHIDESPPAQQGEPPEASAPANPPPSTSEQTSPSGPSESSSQPDKDRAPEKLARDRGLKVVPTWGFWTSAGVSAALLGVTVWSGLDTLSAADDYEQRPTQEGLDEGRSLELRTNVLIGVTAGAAVATLALGFFFTDWGQTDDEHASSGDLTVSLGAWSDGLSHCATLSTTY